MLMPRVLVAEDDPDLRSVLVRGLREEGFDATGLDNGAAFLRAADERRADVLIVDIGLPDADGRDICQALRTRGVSAPILFLTARDAMVDRLSGFSAGGDDYVTKPFDFDELVARLHALMRRSGVDLSLQAAGLRLDPVTHTVCCGGETGALTPTEFRLLARLATRPGEAVRRRDLVAAGWPRGAIVHDNTLDAYIARLRRKLRGLPRAPSIATVRGVGYAIR
jgi:two-component system OmpR family response regulator